MRGTVIGLARYPVKSMLGEARTSLDFDARGPVGDRLWAVRDAAGKLGSGKATRRFRRIDGLLAYAARYDESGRAVVTTPDGEILLAGDPAADVALSGLLGLPVTLAREDDVRHVDAAGVSLTTTGSLRALGELLGDDRPADARRFRKNILLDLDEPWAEEAWVGAEIDVGAVRLRVTKRIERCVMVGLPQPGVPADGRVLRALTDARDACLGVYAEVVEPGRVALGDAARPVSKTVAGLGPDR
jgi:hypothetical protein